MNTRANEHVNERALANSICRVLDEGTQHLPWRVTERLAAARAKALSRVIVPAPRTFARAESGSTTSGLPAGATAFVSKPSTPATPQPLGPAPLGWSLRRRVFATALPIAMMLVGFVMVDIAQQEQSTNELLEVDSALLTDEVPLVAYADRGFGVFIKNTRQ